MGDKRYILSEPDIITISGNAADKLIRSGNGTAALLYLYTLRHHGISSINDAASAVGTGVVEAEAAMALLDRLGLIRTKDTPLPPVKDEMPEYTADDIRRELDNGSIFKALVDNVQRSLGRILSADDLIKLFGIYDYLGFPPEVILQLVTYCIGESRRKYGPGRRPTMRYIEKAAYTWEREGIMTLDQAEAYIRRVNAMHTATGAIRRVLNIRDRELSASERRYAESWVSMGFSPEAVEIAYDRTLVKTGKRAWGYMNSILTSWHEKGLHTPEEIATGDLRKETHPTHMDQNSQKRASAPTSADLNRMRKLLEKMKEG
jgi:DnaD/phage-associated family protein